jgi:Ca-activated chloride channel family protein
MNFENVGTYLGDQYAESIFRLGLPLMLLLLLLLPFVLWYLRYRERRKTVTLALPVAHLAAAVPRGNPRRWRLILDTMRVAALALLIVAMARPQYGRIERETFSEGIDIALVLDVSLSMRAGDFHPNRLEAAKDVIKQFVLERRGDRLGLVIFGGEAATLVPLTLDSDVVYSFIERVRFNLVSGDTTAIGMGLATALDRLRDSDAKSKVVILLTDGENNAGKIDPQKAAEAARALGVRVYTIGVGSNAPQIGPFGMRVDAGLDEATLKQMAEITGGQYFRAVDEQKLNDIYQQIDKLEKSKIESTQYDNFNELVHWFVVPALLLLLLEMALRSTRFVLLP